MPWSTDDIPSQEGRTAVVTGSNTGLGFEVAAELAGAGATTVLACRSTEKADHARGEILGRYPDAVVEVLRLDLGDLSQVRDAAAETVDRFPAVDLLINNAGVMVPPRSTTADGFELQFGTNHLGHFAYTGLVLPAVLAAGRSRVVTVSSLAHQQGRMRWDDLQWERGYDRFRSYAQSKLANLLFAFELQRRLMDADRNGDEGTISLAAHPGVSATELGRYIPGATLPGVKQVVQFTMSLATQSPAGGARPVLRAATDPAAGGFEYYGPSGFNEMRGAPVVVQPMGHARDRDDWARLWAVSEELTGVTYPL